MGPIQNQQGAKTLSARTDFVQIVQFVTRRDRAPTAADRRYQIGTAWIDKVGGRAYQLVRVDNLGAHWVEAGGVAGPLNDLAGDTGDALPAAGSITVAGGDNITTAASGSTLTVSLDADITVDSATLSDGNLSLEGNLNITLDGGKILAVAASAAAAGDSAWGSVVLVGGTATVATTAVTANSLIFLTVQALGTVGAPQAVHAHTIAAGTNFVITSADGSDTSTVAWFIVN